MSTPQPASPAYHGGAQTKTLLEWSDRILTADTPEAIFH